MPKKYLLAIHDLTGKRLCVVYDSNVPQKGAAESIKITKEINGWKEVSFSLPALDEFKQPNWRRQFINNENLLYLDENGEEDVYTIKSPSVLHDKSKASLTVQCNHNSEELKSKNLFRYFDDTNGIATCETLIRSAIKGSGWTLIACDKFFESDGVTEKVRSYSCDTKTGT